MRIGGIAGQFPAVQLSSYARSGGRIYVPVQPSQTIYAQYRYISGTPASGGQHTVPISKIRLLNALIENLRSIKKDTPVSADILKQSPERTDALIKQYSMELHQALQSKGSTFGTLSGIADTGIVFNLSA